MGSLKIMTMAAAVLFTAGCSAPEPPPPPAKTVFDPLTQNLDRARAVQKTVDENTDKTRNAVQAQENGDASP
jgi:hypothetical protein